jgi:hypothetical protein
MGRLEDSREHYRQQTETSMRSLGTYLPEFNPLIDIYAGLLADYDEAQERFYQEGSAYETTTAAGGTKKSGTVYALERLRADILQYAGRLQLTPQSIEQSRIAEPTNSGGGLLEVLERIERGLSETEGKK